MSLDGLDQPIVIMQRRELAIGLCPHCVLEGATLHPISRNQIRVENGDVNNRIELSDVESYIE